MGRFAVSATKHFSQIDQIVIGDINEESARSFAAQLNHKVTATHLDVTDTNSISTAMQDINIVVNTSGPYSNMVYPFSKPQMRAAVTIWIFVTTGSQP